MLPTCPSTYSTTFPTIHQPRQLRIQVLAPTCTYLKNIFRLEQKRGRKSKCFRLLDLCKKEEGSGNESDVPDLCKKRQRREVCFRLVRILHRLQVVAYQAYSNIGVVIKFVLECAFERTLGVAALLSHCGLGSRRLLHWGGCLFV